MPTASGDGPGSGSGTHADDADNKQFGEGNGRGGTVALAGTGDRATVAGRTTRGIGRGIPATDPPGVAARFEAATAGRRDAAGADAGAPIISAAPHAGHDNRPLVRS